MIWFTSDLHFWHKNVIEYCARPYTSLEEMNESLIVNWNMYVNPSDTVYVLGDFAFCGTEKLKAIVSRLNGDKRIVLGNHDWKNLSKKKAMDLGFSEAVDSAEIEILGEKVLMNHFPYTGDHVGEDRYLSHRPKDEGGWLLHGHVHNAWTVKKKMINVGVDVWFMRPVSLNEIEGIMQEGPRE